MQVKICGLKTQEAVQVAADAKADMIGLVFYPPSPRYVEPEVAAELAAFVKGLQPRPKLVGLFVNPTIDELANAVKAYELDFVQLSGDETAAFCQTAAKLRPVIKTVRTAHEAETFGLLDGVTLLLDSQEAGLYGGTGKTGDWQAAQKLAARYQLLLAGGLTPENVGEAISQVQPWGVDVSSGVEVTGQKGVKDLAKIELFIQRAKTLAIQSNPQGEATHG